MLILFLFYKISSLRIVLNHSNHLGFIFEFSTFIYFIVLFRKFLSLFRGHSKSLISIPIISTKLVFYFTSFLRDFSILFCRN